MRTALPRRSGLGPQEYLEAVDILRTPMEDDTYVSKAVDATLTVTPADHGIAIPAGSVAVSIRCTGGAARYKFTPVGASAPVAGDMKHFIAGEERMELRVIGWDKVYLMVDDVTVPTVAHVSFLE